MLACLVAFMLIDILLIILLSYLKLFKRKYDRNIIREALSEDNRKLITDKEDIKTLEEYLNKFEYYSKSWWYNNTPTYYSRYKKVKKIIEKYNLDVSKVK